MPLVKYNSKYTFIEEGLPNVGLIYNSVIDKFLIIGRTLA